jgi:FtsP/CotA-like multicopper oxidase with cupredoxin domain
LAAVIVVACAMTPTSNVPPTTRSYYIAADDLPWDYVPGNIDQITGHPYTDTAYFKSARPRPVPTRYIKTLYREYTDSTFTRLKSRPPEWEHLGFLGPVIRGIVGDTIRVVFRNNGTHPYSVHPHGVLYGKDSEGAPYVDGTRGSLASDAGVAPGATHVYTWLVPERAGPGPMDGSSIVWMYHSHVDEIRDVNSGLLGPLIVTARGKGRSDGSPIDVDRELVAAYVQVHEEQSWHERENILPAAESAGAPNPNQLQNIYPWFVQFSINGYTHGALPLRSYTVRKGQRVRWYVFASTNDFDGHSPHWHGNTVLVNQMRTDVLNLPAMGMLVADMVPDDIGTWLFHCHVSLHLAAGMQARYAVIP